MAATAGGNRQARIEGATIRSDLRGGSRPAEGDSPQRAGPAGAVQERRRDPKQGSVHRATYCAGAAAVDACLCV